MGVPARTPRLADRNRAQPSAFGEVVNFSAIELTIRGSLSSHSLELIFSFRRPMID